MGRHPTDGFSLVAGVAFLLLGVGWLVRDALDLTLDLRWVAPSVLLLLGALGLLSSLAALRRSAREADAEPDAQVPVP